MLKSSNLFLALNFGCDEQPVEVQEPVGHGPRVLVGKLAAKPLSINSLEVFNVVLLEWHSVHHSENLFKAAVRKSCLAAKILAKRPLPNSPHGTQGLTLPRAFGILFANLDERDRMKFFIPFAQSDEEALSVYGSIRDFLSDTIGAEFSDRQFLSLHYRHDGNEYFAEVGKTHTLNGETVIAILHNPKARLYYVCTPNRGVAGDMPILVGEGDVKGIVHFG